MNAIGEILNVQATFCFKVRIRASKMLTLNAISYFIIHVFLKNLKQEIVVLQIGKYRLVSMKCIKGVHFRILIIQKGSAENLAKDL